MSGPTRTASLAGSADAATEPPAVPVDALGDESRSASPTSIASPANVGHTSGDSSPTEHVIVGRVSRRVVDVAGKVSQTRLSPVWRYMTKFEPALKNGKNVICQIVKPGGEVCGYLTTHHKSKSGTGNLVKHLESQHKGIHAECMQFSSHSSVSQRQRGQVGAGAGAKPGTR